MEKIFTITKDDFILIPIEFNEIKRKNDYAFGGFFLHKETLEEILSFCKEKNVIYILDFKNIQLCEDRIFDVLCGMKKNRIFLANLHQNNKIYEKFKHSLESEKYECLMNGIILFSQEYREQAENIELKSFYKCEVRKLVSLHTHEWKEILDGHQWGYLVSSGVYSEQLIDMKELFYCHQDTLFIIYMLYNSICEWGGEFDGFVATSKNGVAFGAILGEIFRKELLCFNIGQMFEEIYNRLPEIEAGKRYIHIFDMICLGSEAKVVNALVSAQGGNLVHSFGIVCLLDLEAVNRQNRYSFLNHVSPLVRYEDLDVEYRISLIDDGR